jgi:hypothetical protein
MAIISISGRIGAGKDLAGELIQQITPYHNWEVKKFAGKLKQIASMLTGIPTEKFEDQEFKQTHLPSEWDTIKMVGTGLRQDGFNGPKTPVIEHMTVRDLLQKLGTEGMREGLHQNVWVNALFADYRFQKVENGFSRIVKSSEGIPIDYEYEVTVPNWIITDTRFPNELKAIKDYGGVTIKIVRDSGNTVGTQHISETALDHVQDWDYVIDNTGTIEELKQKLYDILSKESLIKYTGL